MRNKAVAQKIASPSAPALYAYHMGEVYTNGAMEMVFNPLFQLPGVLFRGSGRLAGSLNCYQPNQVQYNNSVPTNSYGGTQAGGIALQGLLDEIPSM